MARLTKKASLEWKPVSTDSASSYRVYNMSWGVNRANMIVDNNYVGAFQSDKNRLGGRFTEISFTSEMRGFDDATGDYVPENGLLQACGFDVSSDSPVTTWTYVLGDLHTVPAGGDVQRIDISQVVDGLKSTATNCVGTVTFNWVAQQIPTMDFSFRGIYTGKPAAGSAAAFVTGEIPVMCETFSLTVTPSGSSAVTGLRVASLSYAVNNEINPRPDLNGTEGFADPRLEGREPEITAVVEMDYTTFTDFESYLENSTELAWAFTHNSGGSAGNSVAVSFDAHLADMPVYSDDNGIYVVELKMTQSIDSGATPLTLVWS